METLPLGAKRPPDQTLAFRRVLQTAVLHVQSAGRQEVHSGDVLAATLQQSRSYAAQLLAAQGVTRLDVLEYITHGISKVPPAPHNGDEASSAGDAEAGTGERGGASARDPLSAYARNLTARAKAGELDPLIGRTDELQRTLEILESVFHKGPSEAYRLMLQVHTQGRAQCGVYPFEVAETKVATVIDRARDQGFPLRATMEKD
jgi:ATP-dependent Clp protease ATP-binding subunit ClpA